MKKRVVFAMAVFLSLAIVLTSCSVKKNGTSSGNSLVAGAGTYPIVKDKVTINVFANVGSTITDINTNAETVWLENKTNVHINWTTVGQNEGKEKLSVLLASGQNLPDVIMLANANPIITNEQIATYGAQGEFIALDNLISKYGVNARKDFEEYPDAKKQMTSPDGKIYALPNIQDVYHTSLPQKMWINQSWLTKLGLKMPTTTAEFEAVLKAFKTQDPNGNGKADEIPMSGRSDTSSEGLPDAFLMNAFQYSPGYEGDNFYYMYLDNKKVTFAPTQNGWKQGLAYMHTLYTEGLIDKEIFINTKNQLLALTGNPNGNMVGCFSELHVGGGVNIAADTVKDYVVMPPLKGPAGQVSPYAPTKYAAAYIITKACKNPDVAFRLADTLMQNPADNKTSEALNTVFGPENSGWQKAASGSVGLTGAAATFIDLVSSKSSQNGSWSQMGPIVYPESVRDQQVVDSTKYNEEKVLYDSTKTIETYKVNKTLPYLNFTSDESSQLSDIPTNVQKYVNSMMASFVTGTADINSDTAWNNYVTQLNNMGLQNMLKIYQTAYNRYSK